MIFFMILEACLCASEDSEAQELEYWGVRRSGVFSAINLNRLEVLLHGGADIRIAFFPSPLEPDANCIYIVLFEMAQHGTYILLFF